MKHRILIIDDEAGFTKMVKLNLESTGDYIVIEENKAYNALSTALKCRPDLIFLDIVMPGKDGGEVAAQLRSDRSLAGVPIVFLTAIASKSDVSGDGMIGGYPFLAKPVSLDDLKTCINKHLA